MIEAFCRWLAATAPSQALARLEWFVPLTQSLHILGLAACVSSLGLLAVRVLAGGAAQQGPDWAARWTPPLHAGLAVLLLSGLALTLVEPARELLNPLFRLKMLLLLVLLACAGFLLRRLRAGLPVPRAPAALTLLLLVTLASLGRFIAYV